MEDEYSVTFTHDELYTLWEMTLSQCLTTMSDLERIEEKAKTDDYYKDKAESWKDRNSRYSKMQLKIKDELDKVELEMKAQGKKVY